MAQRNKTAKSTNGAAETDWVTLREASDQTGVSVSTLRNWYRKGLVNSRVEKGPNGAQRLVRLEEVGERVRAKVPADPTPAQTSSVDSESVSSQLRSLIEELAEARERAGRAEARAELLAQQLNELRSQASASLTDETLKTENEMLRERLDLLRERTDELARRLDADDVDDPVGVDELEEPLVPPEEEDEYLAMTQRWRARRKRRKFARREAKLSRG